MASGQGVSVVVQAVKSGILQPGVLNEFKLSLEVSCQADEVQPGSMATALGWAVAASAAQEAVQITGV